MHGVNISCQHNRRSNNFSCPSHTDFPIYKGRNEGERQEGETMGTQETKGKWRGNEGVTKAKRKGKWRGWEHCIVCLRRVVCSCSVLVLGCVGQCACVSQTRTSPSPIDNPSTAMSSCWWRYTEPPLAKYTTGTVGCRALRYLATSSA